MAAANKRSLYVGGLDRQVTEEVLYAAFVPFGPLKSVQVPVDFQTRASKGFGFVEFEDEEDARAAIDNMDDSELFGKTLRVTIAKPERQKLGSNKPGTMGMAHMPFANAVVSYERIIVSVIVWAETEASADVEMTSDEPQA